MKVVNLCKDGCCPVVKIAKDFVEIGKDGNLCKLKMDEWDSLKEKILNKEIRLF